MPLYRKVAERATGTTPKEAIRVTSVVLNAVLLVVCEVAEEAPLGSWVAGQKILRKLTLTYLKPRRDNSNEVMLDCR